MLHIALTIGILAIASILSIPIYGKSCQRSATCKRSDVWYSNARKCTVSIRNILKRNGFTRNFVEDSTTAVQLWEALQEVNGIFGEMRYRSL